MKRKRVKCRHCKMGFLVVPGKFPKKLFDHIRKKHPMARRKARKTHAKGHSSRRSRKTASSTSRTSDEAPEAPAGFIVETVTYRRV